MTPVKRTSKRAPKKASAKSSSASMSSSQKAIYTKLKRKGMSDKQAEVFSKHAAKRKDSATRNKMAVGSAKKSVSKKRVSKTRKGAKRG